METYVTDSVVDASELRVLASVVVVAMRGGQEYEKEGYCREGLHGSRSLGGRAKAWLNCDRPPITTASTYVHSAGV